MARLQNTSALTSPVVMRGLDPRIHRTRKGGAEVMDGRVKPGHDERTGEWP